MSKINDLMGKQMTRRQFLLSLGGGFFGLLGVASLLGIIGNNEPEEVGPPPYGMLNYGP